MFRLGSLLTISITFFSSHIAFGQDRDSFRVIFEKAIEAHGVDTLTEFPNLRIKLDGTFKGAPFTSEIWSTTGKYRQKFALPQFNLAFVMIMVGDKGWKTMEFEGGKSGQLGEMKPDEVEAYTSLQRHLMMTHSFLKAIQSKLKEEDEIPGEGDALIVTDVQENEKPAIRISSKEGESTSWTVFQKDTGLLMRVGSGKANGKIDEEFVFGNHFEKNGVKIAGRTEVTLGGEKVYEFKVLEIEFPKSFDDSLFEVTKTPLGAHQSAPGSRPNGATQQSPSGNKNVAKKKWIMWLEESKAGKWAEVPERRYEYVDYATFQTTYSEYNASLETLNRNGRRFQLNWKEVSE